jgi:hypothetical protein
MGGVASGMTGNPGNGGNGKGDAIRDALHHNGKGSNDGRTGRAQPSPRQLQLVQDRHVKVDWNQFGTPMQVVGIDGAPLATGLSGDPGTAARQYIEKNRDLFGMSDDAVAALEVVAVHPIGKGSAVLLRQNFGGLQSGNDGFANIAVRDGSVLYASSSLARKAPKPAAAKLSETDALKAAAKDVGLDLGKLSAQGLIDGWNRYDTSTFGTRQSVRLVAVPMPDDTVRTAYEVAINGNDEEVISYTSYVDARSGEVLVRQDNVNEFGDDDVNPAWAVFPANPSLDYSSTDTRQTWCWAAAVGCDRAVANDSSPLGWDADPAFNGGKPSNTTRGNNVREAKTWTGSFNLANVATAYPDRQYKAPWTNQWHDMACAPESFTTGTFNDIDAAMYNLFVAHNRMHDFSYKLGFTEINRNMQVTNFGKGGREADPEHGNAQSGARSATLTRNNANQSTPTDGSPGTTNMYLWQPVAGSFYAPCVDGDYDMSVIGHEYTHAISNRMVNGGLSGTHGGSMGESWSDLVATEYLHEYNFVPTTNNLLTAVGPYATGNSERGIRNFNIETSPLNYSNFGFDLTGPEVHSDGEVWNAIQWQVRKAFIDRYGAGTPAELEACADGKVSVDNCPGSRKWIQLMFDAWLLMPRAVTMVGARDAMLAADLTRFGGANQDLMWEAFAKRGLGKDATATSGSDTAPKPSFKSGLSTDSTVRFVPAGDADATTKMNVFVGDYQARSRAIADTDPLTTLADTAAMVPGTYSFFVQAPGFGLQRLTATIPAGQQVTLKINLGKNLAAAVNGATATGDGLNLNALIDENEATNWAYLGNKAEPVAGKAITVKLAGDTPQIVRRVQVSAMLRPQISNDPGGDKVAQSRYSALRSFQVQACTATATVACTKDSDYHVAYTSAGNAFPAELPRPVTPMINLRSFDIPATQATHLRLVVLSSQCTGNPQYAGQQTADLANPSDCVTGSATSGHVRIAEFEAFSGEGPTVGSQVITADVAGGPLTLSVSGNLVTMPNVTLNGFDQIIEGALNTATVTDARGSGSGWSLTGQVSDFVGGSGIIPADNLGWVPSASAIASSLPTAPGSTSVVGAGPAATPGAGTGLADAKLLCSTAPGSSGGAFTCGADLKLGIPASTRLGTYVGVLTLTLV